MTNPKEWSGTPDPRNQDFWIDDETNERVCAHCCHRVPQEQHNPYGDDIFALYGGE
jgi:hypothetical protein